MQAQRCADVAEPTAAGRPRLPDLHRMKLALDVAAPEFKEPAELGKVRSEVELRPDEALQQIGMVRHAVDDLGGGQPILTKLGNGGHSVSSRLAPANREHAPSVSPQQQKTSPKQQVSSSSQRVLPRAELRIP